MLQFFGMNTHLCVYYSVVESAFSLCSELELNPSDLKSFFEYLCLYLHEINKFSL